MTMRSTYVFDVTDATFQTAVLERSRTVPVVVDFWAPWCGPCRQLGPILERLADEQRGAFELAKLNTDESPRIATTFRIEGIPAVKAFKDGKLVNEFTGALPEAQVRRFLSTFLPSEADKLAARGDEFLAAGYQNAAEDAYRDALEQQPLHAGATVGLARVLASLGSDGTAEALRLLAQIPNDPRAAQLRAELGLRDAASKVDLSELEARVAADAKDVAARYELGRALAAQGDYEPALDHLLNVVTLDRSFEDDAGRKALLDVFNLLGDDNPLTQTYRKRLSYLLF